MIVLGNRQSSSEAIEVELNVTFVPILESAGHYKIVLTVLFRQDTHSEPQQYTLM